MNVPLKQRLIQCLKNLLYAWRGEPYSVAGTTLRFVPGTRPVRVKYRNSPNGVSRYDALLVEYVCAHLREGDFAMDVGAHAGQFGLIMATLCGQSGRVISFEPDRYARALLERNLALNPDISRVTVESCAMSDRGGEATLFSRGGDANSSLSQGAISSTLTADVEALEVTLCTFDDYLRDSRLPMPNLIKIDTEGAEIRILAGASTLLASDATILVELHPYAWDGFGNSFAELQQLLAGSGRHMRYLDQLQPAEGEPTYGIVVLER